MIFLYGLLIIDHVGSSNQVASSKKSMWGTAGTFITDLFKKHITSLLGVESQASTLSARKITLTAGLFTGMLVLIASACVMLYQRLHREPK